jgi:Putative zinc-finger
MSDDRVARAYQAIPAPDGHLSEEAWERFLDGELAGPEREAAVHHITRCPECARVHRGLVAFEGESGPLRSQHARKGPAAVWRWAGAAAAALAAITIFVARPRIAQAPSGEVTSPASAPAASVALPSLSTAVAPLPVRVAQDRAVVYRGGGDDPAAFLKAFDEAIAPYRSGRYADAVASLAALRARFPEAPEPPLYEGVALLMTSRTAEAGERLARAERLAAGTEWAPDAEYYSARARLQNGQSEGRATLNRLCASPGPYRQPACDALAPPSPSR